MKQNNWTTSCTQNEAEHEGDFDLTGKCDWKSDQKCSTWRMRRRFAKVLTTITIQHMHRTQTDYLFMVAACKCQGQTQTEGQKESSNCQATCIGRTSSRKWRFQQPQRLTSFTDEQSNWLGLFNMQHILFHRLLTITIDQLKQKPTTIKWLQNQLKFLTKGLFTWKWGTPGRWGNLVPACPYNLSF